MRDPAFVTAFIMISEPGIVGRPSSCAMKVFMWGSILSM